MIFDELTLDVNTNYYGKVKYYRNLAAIRLGQES